MALKFVAIDFYVAKPVPCSPVFPLRSGSMISRKKCSGFGEQWQASVITTEWIDYNQETYRWSGMKYYLVEQSR